MHRLPRAARVAIAVYLAFIAITGTAEGAYHLTHAYKPSPGLRFAPEMIGLRTQPPPRYEPLRASGRAVGRSVVIRETKGDLPPWSVIMCESKGSYTAENPRSSASGRYQIVDGTWAGFGGYTHASDAPPETQDAKARELWNGGRGASHWAACL